MMTPKTTESTTRPIATIPVTLVAGYLGAGKTTWLNRRLRSGVESGTLVLVNDFGAINIDAALIDYRGDRLLSLDNGCLCCSLSDALGTQLSRIARWPEPPTALIIETSGVALPGRIADMIRIASRFHLESIVTLIALDALSRHRRDGRIADLVESQIVAANVFSLNRGETLTGNELMSSRAWLASLNPHAVFEPAWSTPPESVGEAPVTPSSISQHVDAVTFRFLKTESASEPGWQRFTRRLPPLAERNTLETLLAHYATALARAKGFLQLGEHHYVFHWSGGRASWTPSAPRPGAGQLVGIGFAGTELNALLNALDDIAAPVNH